MNNNLIFYADYYNKPSWWFMFRYDTQVKRKTIFYLLQQGKVSLKNQSILEIGFGSGDVLLSFDTTCAIYGTEISPSALSRIKKIASTKGYRTNNFSKSNGAILEYPANFFDIVIASHVLEHIEDDLGLLGEIYRVLKTQGVAVLLIPINEKYPDTKHIHAYDGLKLIELAKQVGLTIVDLIENELIYHPVEKFYYNECNRKLPIIGPLITVAFNLATFWMPFRLYRFIDNVMEKMGLKPRQFGVVLRKRNG